MAKAMLFFGCKPERRGKEQGAWGADLRISGGYDQVTARELSCLLQDSSWRHVRRFQGCRLLIENPILIIIPNPDKSCERRTLAIMHRAHKYHVRMNQRLG